MNERVNALLPLSDYHAARSHVFPSDTSLDWYLRKHRSALIEAGALLMVAGRWLVQPSTFDTYVLERGTQAARGRVKGVA